MYRFSLVIFFLFLSKFSDGVPVQRLEEENDFPISPLESDTEVTIIKNFTNDGKNSSQDLFVIKTIVYEIGILTDAGNDTDFDNETHEQIDIAFFDADNNGTFVDLSHIPIPIQTNVSGVSITGILPANLGNLAVLKDGTPTTNGANFPLFPNKQVKVSHNISTHDKDASNSILEGLPEILGLKDLLKHKSSEESAENNSGEDKSKERNKSGEDKKSKESSGSGEDKKEVIDTEEIE